MIKAVIFDLDGTLVDSIPDLSEAVNNVISKYGFPKRKKEEFNIFVGNGFVDLLLRAMNHNVDEETFEKIKKEFVAYYDVHYCDKTVAYDGIAELIAALRERGIKTAVVTNKNDDISKIIVNKYFGDVFDVIRGKADDIPAKPDPTGTLLTMQKLSVKPEECVFVGDSGIDMLTGTRSGAVAVGETWGYRDEAELRENGARFIINTPNELLGIISDINNELQ